MKYKVRTEAEIQHLIDETKKLIASGMSQTNAAKQLGYTKSSYWKWLKTRKPEVVTFDASTETTKVRKPYTKRTQSTSKLGFVVGSREDVLSLMREFLNG